MVTVPLIALAIPSLLIGALTVEPVLFGGYFGRSIFVLPANDVMARVGGDFSGALLPSRCTDCSRRPSGSRRRGGRPRGCSS